MRTVNSYSGGNQPYWTFLGVDQLDALIFGCGRLPNMLIEYLQQEGYNITVIASEQNPLIELEKKYSISTILIKDPLIQDYLHEANMSIAEMFFALSSCDNTNIMLSQIAKHLFNVNTVICHIEDPNLHDIYSELGLDVIGKSDSQLYQKTINLIEA